MPSLAQMETQTGNTVGVGVPILTSYQSTGRKSQNGTNEHFQNEVRSNKNQFDTEIGAVKNGYSNHTNGNGVAHVEPELDMDTTDFVNGNKIHVNGNNGFSQSHFEEVIKKEKVSIKSQQISVTPLKSAGLHTTAPVTVPPQGEDSDPSLSWLADGNVYDQGPDQIIPSSAVYTWHANGAVRINKLEGTIGNLEPLSVPSLLKGCADKNPDRVALTIKRDDEWVKWTFKEYYNDVRTCAKGFIALGLERYHSVCILGFNSPEWFISDLGAIFAGGMGAGIYTTNSAEACEFCAVDSKAQIYVVEDEKQLAKILEFRDRLPGLKAIVQYSGEPKEKGVLSWTQLMHLGSQQSDEKLEQRLKSLAVNQCCTLIYTSGTTGNPKGVMLTHDNLTWMARVNKNWANFRDVSDDFQEIVISFLPLSHVAAKMADIYAPLSACGMIAFADKNALKGSLVENMKEVKPTKFLAVPRVWEKMYEKITEIGRSTTGIKKMVATWAKNKGFDYNMKRMNGVSNPETLGFKIANKVVLSKVREALGLSRCDLHLSGAAPLSPDILKFFMSLNVVVTEAYGMSECSGPHTMATDFSFRVGSVGKTMTGCVTKIDKPNSEGCGEICMMGRHLTIGYLAQPEKTRGAIDEEGWLHSEDIGRVDQDGYLFITGRIKELLITAGGENVAPVPIEDNIKSELPLVSQAVVLGDKLKFLSVLLTFKTEVDMNSQEPLDKLTKVTKEWIEKNGNCSVETIQDVIREVYDKQNVELGFAIQAGIDRANKRAVSQAQRIQKWVILPQDFSIPGGELGPTLKLKRQTVYDKYKDAITQLYNV